jgi:hypothetical protein
VAWRVFTNNACRSLRTPGSPFANSAVIGSLRFKRSSSGFLTLASGASLATSRVRLKKRVLVPAACRACAAVGQRARRHLRRAIRDSRSGGRPDSGTEAALKTGELNYRVMGMLDAANTGAYGHPSTH